MKLFLYPMLAFILVACASSTSKANSTAAPFEQAFNDVKIRWDTAFDALNKKLEACDEIKEKNTITLPSKEDIASIGLTQRQFDLGLFLLYNDLYKTCAQDAYYKASYELGVYNHFIHENLEQVRSLGLMPDEEYHLWNDYTGNSEIIFEEDILMKQNLRDEIGPLTNEQKNFLLEVSNNKPFDPIQALAPKADDPN